MKEDHVTRGALLICSFVIALSATQQTAAAQSATATAANLSTRCVGDRCEIAQDVAQENMRSIASTEYVPYAPEAHETRALGMHASTNATVRGVAPPRAGARFRPLRNRRASCVARVRVGRLFTVSRSRAYAR